MFIISKNYIKLYFYISLVNSSFNILNKVLVLDIVINFILFHQYDFNDK